MGDSHFLDVERIVNAASNLSGEQIRELVAELASIDDGGDAILVQADRMMLEGKEKPHSQVESAWLSLEKLKWDFIEDIQPTRSDWDHYCAAYMTLRSMIPEERRDELLGLAQGQVAC